MIRAIIFDFDGVILDSVDIKTRAFARLFEEHGPEVVKQVVDYHLAHGGVSRFRKFEHIHREFLHRPLQEAESARLGERFSALVFDEVVKAAWIPGAPEFLEQNHTRYRLFIASGTPQQELQQIVQLRRLDRFFAGIFGSPTRKEQIICDILRQNGWAKREVLFVGDALTDYRAAETAQIGFIGVGSAGKNPFPEGTQVLPDLRLLGEQITGS